MSLKESLEKLKFDARMIDINKKSKALADDELNTHLAGLPDLKDSSIAVDLDNMIDDSDMDIEQ